MALSKLSGDEQGILFVQLCNVLDPGVASANGPLATSPSLPASRALAPAAGRRLPAQRASSTSSTWHVTILGVAQGADHRARRLAVALTVEVSAAAEHDTEQSALPQRDAHG